MKLFCLGILLSFVMSFAQISVELKDEQPYNSTMLGLRARIINSSGQSYDNVTVNVLLKKNPSETFVLDAYYTEGWNCSIAEQSGEYLVVKMVIPHLGTGTAPNESGISLGIHRSDWQQLQKTNENGFPSGIAFTTALNYSVYQGNVLIGGNAYVDPNSVVPSLRFVGLQPEDRSDGSVPAWIEIENYGSTPADLSNISLVWPTSTGTSSSVVSSAILQPGKRLRICAVQLNCPDDDVVATVLMLSMGATGEVLLRYNETAIDYLSWGINDGVLAADAREANIQYTMIRYDRGFYRSYDENWNYVTSGNGLFYKKIEGKWLSYSSSYDVNTTERPAPIPYIDAEILCLEGSTQSQMVRFAWHPVEGAIGYNLTVRRKNGQILFDQFTPMAFHDMDLGAGEFEWSVRVVFWSDRYAVSNPWIDHYSIWKTKTIQTCGDITQEKYLNKVPHYGVHKDTRMLVPNWGELAVYPEISWDHPDIFVYNNNRDFYERGDDRDYANPWGGNTLFLEVDWRCWAVAVQILNHYYHGNLTQDEIKFYGKTVGFENEVTAYGTYTRSERDKVISPFVLGNMGGGYDVEVKVALKWALKLTDDSQLENGLGNYVPFDQNLVMEHIDAERPILYLQDGHFMIVDGYRFSGSRFQVHRVNLYNGGEVGWTYNEYPYISVNCYFVPKNVTSVEMSDYRVHIDSDGDGIVDFDEEERFHTDSHDKDSDGDGIEDKVEIFSYTIKEKFEKPVDITSRGWYYTRLSRLGDYDFYYDPAGDLFRTEFFADIDGDGKRAEMDKDSDHPNNDGLWDGAEDLNHNGYVDNGETDPYNIADDTFESDPVESAEWDTPSSVAIYSFEEMNIGDNVTCHSGLHGYCSVASESASRYYAVSLGANSTIGDVFTKGGVQLRNNAHVVGDVSIYSMPMGSITPDIYQNASVTGNASVHTWGEWPYVVSDNAYHSLEGSENWLDLTVCPGQTVTLSGDVAYRNLKVEAGGTLKLGAGTIRVKNITMEWGSRLEFINPGRETLLIADGYVIWRAQIVNSDLQTVAKGFKLIEYAPGYIHIEGDWAGTIFARWSELTLGQVKKTAYGSFVAKKVYLGNGLTIYRVHFSPIPLTDLV